MSEPISKEEQSLKYLQYFMEVDQRIKSEMIRLAPPSESDVISNDDLIKYTDNFYDAFKYIKVELRKIANGPGGSPETIENLIAYWEERFIRAGVNYNLLREFYRDCISDMKPSLVAQVKRECVGYTLLSNPSSCLRQATTLNEVLHVLHAAIVNNNSLYSSLPKLNSKQKVDDEEINLYGVNNEMSRIIFEEFPLDSKAGATDIVGISDSKVMIMIRDLGHALTIELDIEGNNIYVKYFIPKLCNIEEINKLKGINKVRDDADIFCGATGEFATDKEHLTTDLFSFLEMVPTDIDMLHNRV